MVEKGTSDPFVLYGLAMEYRSAERPEDALATFERLRREHADYLPMYLICGQLLADQSQTERAREWLESGLTLATQKGDGKAKGELAEALAQLD